MEAVDDNPGLHLWMGLDKIGDGAQIAIPHIRAKGVDGGPQVGGYGH
jgi:hypothetical protein